jgi:hypothetical protein
MSAPNTREPRTPNVNSFRRCAERLWPQNCVTHYNVEADRPPLTAAKMLIAMRRATTQGLTVFRSVRGLDFAWPKPPVCLRRFQFHHLEFDGVYREGAGSKGRTSRSIFAAKSSSATSNS